MSLNQDLVTVQQSVLALYIFSQLLQFQLLYALGLYTCRKIHVAKLGSSNSTVECPGSFYFFYFEVSFGGSIWVYFGVIMHPTRGPKGRGVAPIGATRGVHQYFRACHGYYMQWVCIPTRKFTWPNYSPAKLGSSNSTVECPRRPQCRAKCLMVTICTRSVYLQENSCSQIRIQ